MLDRNRMYGWLLTATAACMLLPLTAGCKQAASGGKTVVATTGMISDLVRRVSAGNIEPIELMGPGVDPHIYKPTESDMRNLDQAGLVFYNGLHLEGNMAHMLEKNPKARAVTKDIPTNLLLEDAGQHDPHVWFDVSLWIHALNTVETELAAFDPANAERYRNNAAAYRKELEALHEEVKRDLATVPKPQRVMVTAHDAFRYFGGAYDIEVHGLQGVSTATEAGLREVQRLVDLIVERKIKAIFVESSVPPDGVNKVVERCKDRGHVVQIPDATLYSDAMDQPGTAAGTYPGMVRHNVRLIVDALR